MAVCCESLLAGLNKNKHLENATKHVQRGQLDRAVKELQKILEHDPEDVPVRLKVAGLLARLSKPEGALKHYDTVAKHYVKQGFNARAVAVFELMVKIDPQRVDLHMKLGDLYSQLFRRADALREFQIVATYFDAKGKAAESLDVLRKMAEIQPENARVRRKVAELMVQQGQPAEAKAELERLAETLRQKGEPGEIGEVLDRIAALAPKDLDALRNAARAHLDRKDPRRALARLQSAFAIDPHDAATLALLAEAFEALGNRVKTLAVLRELAKIHDRAGRLAQRDDVWREVNRIDPNDPDALDALEPPIPLTERTADEPNELLVYSGARPKNTESAPAPAASEKRGARREAEGPTKGGSMSEPKASEERGARREAEGPTKGGSTTVARLLSEADIYLRYGAKAKTIEYLDAALEKDPGCLASHPKLAAFHRRVISGEVSVPGRTLASVGAAKPEFVEVSVEVSQVLAGMTSPTSELQEQLDEADFFVRQELFDEAIRIFRELAARFPQEPQIREKLTAAEAAHARDTESSAVPPAVVGRVPLAKIALVKRPAKPARELELDLDGVAKMESAPPQQVSVAEVLLEMSGEMEIGSGRRSSFELGLTYRDMGLADEALAAFEKALAEPEHAAQAREQIGLVKFERGDVGGALKSLEKAVKLANPKDRAAIEFSYGTALEAAGRFQEAAALYRRLLEQKSSG